MGDVKAMPYSEKCDVVRDNTAFGERLAAAFIRTHLDDQASTELREAQQEGIRPIPEDASAEEQYETAYGNWIWTAKTNLEFIRERMGDAGITRFVDFEAEALKHKNASPSLLMLSVIRALSAKTAFNMTAKEFAYQLQWITPFSVSELNPDKAVFDIPRCKVLDYPETEDVCQVGCQRVYPKWVAEQFKVGMEFDLQGYGCKCTVTPLG